MMPVTIHWHTHPRDIAARFHGITIPKHIVGREASASGYTYRIIQQDAVFRQEEDVTMATQGVPNTGATAALRESIMEIIGARVLAPLAQNFGPAMPNHAADEIITMIQETAENELASLPNRAWINVQCNANGCVALIQMPKEPGSKSRTSQVPGLVALPLSVPL